MDNRSYFGSQSAGIQLFLLFGLFFLCYLLALLITAGISLIGLPAHEIAGAKDLSDLMKFNLDDPEFVSKLKWAQLIASIMIFIVPPLVFVKLTQRSGTILNGSSQEGMAGYFNLNKSFPSLFILMVPVLVMASLPLINFMAELNAKMDFPGFLQGVERWMKAAEEDAKKMTEVFLKMDTPFDLGFNLLMIAIIPAIGEELLFRGVVQKLFTRWTGKVHWGIWISAALFSALHGQFYGFLPRMALGGLLGYLLLWSGSLWVPILAHFINNGGAVIVAYFIQRGTISKEVENIGTGQDEMYFLLSSLILVSALIWMIWQRRVSPPAFTQ